MSNGDGNSKMASISSLLNRRTNAVSRCGKSLWLLFKCAKDRSNAEWRVPTTNLSKYYVIANPQSVWQAGQHNNFKQNAPNLGGALRIFG